MRYYNIEENHIFKADKEKVHKAITQMNILDYRKDYFIEKVNDLDISKLTPIEAINVLYELTEEAKKLKGNE